MRLVSRLRTVIFNNRVVEGISSVDLRAAPAMVTEGPEKPQAVRYLCLRCDVRLSLRPGDPHLCFNCEYGDKLVER